MAKKELDTEIEATEEESAEPRVYELAFHLDPEISENEAKKAYESFRTLIEDNGTLVAEGAPEKIQLAYTISRSETSGRRDFTSAYFCWIAYEAAGEGHQAVTGAAAADKRIIRFLDIRTEKEVAKHAAEMRELREKAPEPANESVSDTELDAALESAAA